MYTMHAHQSGITVPCNATTLAGAKREATQWITFGGGSVTVLENGLPIATREFWQSGRLFGWEKWRAA